MSHPQLRHEPFNLRGFFVDLLKNTGYTLAADTTRTFTFASSFDGLNAPAVAVQAIFGPHSTRYRHVFGSESVSCPVLLEMLSDHAPEHLFPDASCTEEAAIRGPCLTHRGRICKVPAVALDCYMASFVCKPYSTSNAARRTEDPIKKPGASPSCDTFYMTVRHIKNHRPAFFILENVTGMLQKRSDSEQSTPLDFCLDDQEHGLRSIPGYTVGWMSARGTDGSLPTTRTRVFIFGAR